MQSFLTLKIFYPCLCILLSATFGGGRGHWAFCDRQPTSSQLLWVCSAPQKQPNPPVHVVRGSWLKVGLTQSRFSHQAFSSLPWSSYLCTNMWSATCMQAHACCGRGPSYVARHGDVTFMLSHCLPAGQQWSLFSLVEKKPDFSIFQKKIKLPNRNHNESSLFWTRNLEFLFVCLCAESSFPLLSAFFGCLSSCFSHNFLH